MEFIAVGKLRGSVQGKILCFVGPPGVGKTSIGESIAKSLNRKFVRIALGGDRDTSTLKGFRRTYVGAVPGKIVTALKTSQVENPVLLIDEVDKIGQRSAHGDPGSALLEILDPEQNSTFTDDFLDVPIDLSKVLFLCTANMLDTLHPALLDRMEIIRLSGYTFAEKRKIFTDYLLPRAIEKAGLSDRQHLVNVQDIAVDALIQNYCREPGVRSLQRYIFNTMEKCAFKVVEAEEAEGSTDVNIVEVTPDNLIDFVGPPKFSSARFYKRGTPSGVVVGLAYNALGGSILYIEATRAAFPLDGAAISGAGTLRVTGSLGEVMKESATIASTVARNFLQLHFPGDDSKTVREFLDRSSVHIHVPEGAVPKDGPSAGITLTTALLSLALDRPIA